MLQEGEIRPVGSARPQSVNVRVLAATNRDLDEDVRSGRFREDLYYRLSQMTLHVPALRDRPMDIPFIAQQVLERGMRQLGKAVRGFTPETLDCLRVYRWPGNVREMQNEILRMLALVQGDELGAELLSPRVLQAGGSEQEEVALQLMAGVEGTLKERLDLLEARLLKEALIRHRWNKTKAASELGLSRVGLRSKLSRYGLERKGD